MTSIFLEEFFLVLVQWKKQGTCLPQKSDAEHQRVSFPKCRPEFIKEKYISQKESKLKHEAEYGESKT